jgi:aromatic ring-opening dioxygenase catalytic subunit (LigB family)
MSIVFAAAASHAPGLTAWADAAPANQKNSIYQGYERLRQKLEKSGPDTLILLTSEHWANFFLDHIGAFCIGLGDHFTGPVEPWLKVEKAKVPGDPALAREILESCYENGIEPSFSYEMEFDHGTMVPLHFLTPAMDRPVIPIMFNTLAAPQPTPRRCHTLGYVIGRVARRSSRRIGLVATGGLSHDPGEKRHGLIDVDFDHRFLEQMAGGDAERLAQYEKAELAAAGAGAFELLSWIALAGALNGSKGEIVAYEAVKPWATGIGMVEFPQESPPIKAEA